MQLVKVIYITLMLCLFIFGANGQENIRENHIKLKNDSSRILFDKVCMPFNKTDLLLPNPNAKDVETAIDNTNFKADRPVLNLSAFVFEIKLRTCFIFLQILL